MPESASNILHEIIAIAAKSVSAMRGQQTDVGSLLPDSKKTVRALSFIDQLNAVESAAEQGEKRGHSLSDPQVTAALMQGVSLVLTYSPAQMDAVLGRRAHFRPCHSLRISVSRIPGTENVTINWASLIDQTVFP
ncbi:hypothetical protein GCM10019059_39060 [Camelimonas fluminis]|uniref:Uncharacterized protein n=1 Tax=Camelimonas fluminis TaxID=1576911 RepID=A0ABV7UIK2_9HYPH|nr:hypothetical protein [Camelimonas fluminis]GHE75905.1 hypothetical protein GCM10019059_39060 [Camelimonas fluminis]